MSGDIFLREMEAMVYIIGLFFFNFIDGLKMCSETVTGWTFRACTSGGTLFVR